MVTNADELWDAMWKAKQMMLENDTKAPDTTPIPISNREYDTLKAAGVHMSGYKRGLPQIPTCKTPK